MVRIIPAKIYFTEDSIKTGRGIQEIPLFKNSTLTKGHTVIFPFKFPFITVIKEHLNKRK